MIGASLAYGSLLAKLIFMNTKTDEEDRQLAEKGMGVADEERWEDRKRGEKNCEV